MLAAPTIPRNISESVAFPVWTLSWQPPSLVGDQFISYKLTLERDCFPPAEIVTNATSYVIRSLQKDAQYTLSLQAFNSAGKSPKSEYPFFQSSGETTCKQCIVIIWYTPVQGFRHFDDCTLTLIFIRWWRWLYNRRNIWFIIKPWDKCMSNIMTHLPNHLDLYKQYMQWDSHLLQKCKAWSLSSTVSSSPLCIGIPIAFQFSRATYTVIRGETAELVMTTSNILTFNASVILMASGGNATAGKGTSNWSKQSTHCMTCYISCDHVWYWELLFIHLCHCSVIHIYQISHD